MGVYRNDEGDEIHIEERLGISVSPKRVGESGTRGKCSQWLLLDL